MWSWWLAGWLSDIGRGWIRAPDPLPSPGASLMGHTYTPLKIALAEVRCVLVSKGAPQEVGEYSWKFI